MVYTVGCYENGGAELLPFSKIDIALKENTGTVCTCVLALIKIWFRLRYCFYPNYDIQFYLTYEAKAVSVAQVFIEVSLKLKKNWIIPSINWASS